MQKGKTTSWCPLVSPSSWPHGIMVCIENQSYLKTASDICPKVCISAYYVSSSSPYLPWFFSTPSFFKKGPKRVSMLDIVMKQLHSFHHRFTSGIYPCLTFKRNAKNFLKKGLEQKFLGASRRSRSALTTCLHIVISETYDFMCLLPLVRASRADLTAKSASELLCLILPRSSGR